MKTFLNFCLLGMLTLGLRHLRLPLLLAGTWIIVSARGAELLIEADCYMPYTGDSNKGETGFMVDIAKAIWEKKGNTVTYQTRPWRDALDDTRRGESAAIVGANRDDAPDFLFPKVEQAKALGTFYTTTDSSFHYDGVHSLEKVKLGILSDYHYNPEIADYIRKHRTEPACIRAVESSPTLVARFFEMLERKQIDTFVEDGNVIKYYLKTAARPDHFAECGTLRHATSLFVAVSPRITDGDVLVQQLSDGMDTLRSSGELATILSKYGLAEISAPAAYLEPRADPHHRSDQVQTGLGSFPH